MSLINEALKKAQRQRTDQPEQPPGSAVTPGGPEVQPDTGGEIPVRRGRSSRSGAPVILLGAGGAVLVVISVVVTVFLLNRPAPAPAGASPVPPRTNEVASPPPPPGVALPEIKAPVLPRPETVAASAEPVPAPGATPASSVTAPPIAEAASNPSSIPSATAPASTATALPVSTVPLADGKPDPRISAFVDAIRVAGIRSSGNESRVLMNEKVYRVNDLVDRTLAIRLTKVESETLTFTDANGIVYVKSF